MGRPTRRPATTPHRNLTPPPKSPRRLQTVSTKRRGSTFGSSNRWFQRQRSPLESGLPLGCDAAEGTRRDRAGKACQFAHQLRADRPRKAESRSVVSQIRVDKPLTGPVRLYPPAPTNADDGYPPGMHGVAKGHRRDSARRYCWLIPAPSMRTNAILQSRLVRLDHEWLVARWMSTSPFFISVSPSSIIAQISPSRTMA